MPVAVERHNATRTDGDTLIWETDPARNEVYIIMARESWYSLGTTRAQAGLVSIVAVLVFVVLYMVQGWRRVQRKGMARRIVTARRRLYTSRTNDHDTPASFRTVKLITGGHWLSGAVPRRASVTMSALLVLGADSGDLFRDYRPGLPPCLAPTSA